jgi:hypothetical protein
MRDERTKLLTFVNTWMDGVPPNLDKFWQKWRMSSRKRKNKGGEEGGKTGKSTVIGLARIHVGDL